MTNTLNKVTPSSNTTLAVFDIVKFVLALGVIAIHTRFLDYILYPWLRIPVPLFFIISGYFLYLKLTLLSEDRNAQNKIVKNFVIRNLKLYGFWFIVLLPGTLRIRQYFSNGILRGFLTFVRSFLFDSTFVASWFIMATIIATIIVFLLSKRFDNTILLIVTALIYVATALRSSYFPQLQNIPLAINIINLYEFVFYPAYNSFPVALYWIVCGKCFAENKINIKLKHSVPLTILSAILLYLEWTIIKNLNGTYNTDCFIMLLPLCTLLFAIIKEIKPFELKGTVYLRKASVIMFALHGTLVSLGIPGIFFPQLDWLHISNESKNFITTTIICMVASIFILILEKKKWFSWLKYSH